MIAELMAVGLVGIEAYYKDNTEEETGIFLSMADRYGLIATGGTDYHGIDDNSEIMLGGTEVPLEAAERLVALAEERALNRAGS